MGTPLRGHIRLSPFFSLPLTPEIPNGRSMRRGDGEVCPQQKASPRPERPCVDIPLRPRFAHASLQTHAVGIPLAAPNSQNPYYFTCP